MKKLYIFISILLLIIVNLNSEDFTFEAKKIPNPRTTNGGWVTVIGGYLNQDEINELNQEINSIEKEAKAEIAVVVLPNTGGDIFTAAQGIFDEWKIGKKGVDNGLLILAAIDERQFRTHVGYGLEATLPDITCKKLQDKIVIPYFKQGEYGKGLLSYVKKIHEVLTNPSILKEMQQQEEKEKANQERIYKTKEQGKRIFHFSIFIIIGLLILFFGFNLLIKGWRNTLKNFKMQYKSYSKILKIDSTGLVDNNNNAGIILLIIGGFFFIIPFFVFQIFSDIINLLTFIIPVPGIFAGFLLNAIGSSKKHTIVHKWRTEERNCPECHGIMKKLSEQEEDIYLSKLQQIEENLKTMDYDVWTCNSCSNKTIEAFKNWKYAFYIPCPKCNSIACKQVGSYVSVHPTYTHIGTRILNFKCLACGHTYDKSVSIPKLEYSSSSSGGSSWGSGSSGGGSSSFGGGSSGGGGASSSW